MLTSDELGMRKEPKDRGRQGEPLTLRTKGPHRGTFSQRQESLSNRRERKSSLSDPELLERPFVSKPFIKRV